LVNKKIIMERINIKEAEGLIACDDDFTSHGMDNAQFFTLTPSVKGEGWEDVNYYTARSTSMYTNRDGDFDSWVYIMSNPTMPGYYKIGYTKKNPEERAKQISNATGVIVPMEVEWAFHCYNGFALEQECHHKLERYRVSNNREFFQMSLDEAKKTVEELGERYI
tara:strand:+ start:1442 stop:1936 length:495 start_codon:yes stop_codon:yes gene_type:complete